MTTAPDMLRQFGGAPVGSAFGWKDDSSVYFVDGTLGTTGGSGTRPDDAVANISEAITLASEYDVIYVLEHGFSGTDPVAYKETVANLTIPLAKDGIALVGVTHQGVVGRPLSPYIMGMDTTATPVLTVNAPLCSIENLAFTGGWNNASTCTAGIYLPDTIDGTTAPQGTSIYNCSFEDMSGTASEGSIWAKGTWYINIVKTYHRNCVYAVNCVSATNTAIALYVDDINTYADTAAKVETDIYTHTAGYNGILIKNANFAHPIGTGTGKRAATKRYIYCSSTEVGLIANVNYASLATGTHGVIGNNILAPAGVRYGQIFDGTGVWSVLDDS